MAYRRCLSVRAALLARRPGPSFGYISRENDRGKPEQSHSSVSAIEKYCAPKRSFGSCLNDNSWSLRGDFCRPGSGLALSGPCLNRCMSSSTGEASDETGLSSDAVAVITDAPMEAVTSKVSAMGEVAVAAADSNFYIAAFQYLIGEVHSLTGLNWWLSIALTTVLFQGVTYSCFIYLRRAISELKGTKCRPWEKKIIEFYKEYGTVSEMLVYYAVFYGFVFSILDMARKIPSFKTGGALWFIDLTTRDAMYIFPILTALAFLARVELSSAKAETKHMYQVMAIPMALFALNCSKAVYCHWLTWGIFSLCFPYVYKAFGARKTPGVKGLNRRQ